MMESMQIVNHVVPLVKIVDLVAQIVRVALIILIFLMEIYVKNVIINAKPVVVPKIIVHPAKEETETLIFLIVLALLDSLTMGLIRIVNLVLPLAKTVPLWEITVKVKYIIGLFNPKP